MNKYKILFYISVVFFVGSLSVNIATNHMGSEESISDRVDVSSFNMKSVDFKRYWSVEDILYQPYGLLELDEYLLVRDVDSPDPIPVFQKNGEFSHNIGKRGEGPGEFSRNGHQMVGDIHNNKIAIYDTETARIIYYDIETGEVIEEKLLEYLSYPVLASDLLISRTHEQYKYFAIGVELNRDLTLSKDTTYIGYYDEYPELKPAEVNHLLKQGPTTVSGEDYFFGFHDADLILGFNSRGEEILRATSSKTNEDMINLPEVKSHPAIPDHMEGALTSPPRNEYPKHYIGLSNDDNFIYGLYSGFQIETRQDHNRAHYLDQGEFINIFDKETGEYKFTVETPYPWRDLEVNEESVYAISADPKVRISKYSKPEIFNNYD